MNEFLRKAIFCVFMISVVAIFVFAFFVLAKIAAFLEEELLFKMKNVLNRWLK